MARTIRQRLERYFASVMEDTTLTQTQRLKAAVELAHLKEAMLPDAPSAKPLPTLGTIPAK
jgi:hypothetical protein